MDVCTKPYHRICPRVCVCLRWIDKRMLSYPLHVQLHTTTLLHSFNGIVQSHFGNASAWVHTQCGRSLFSTVLRPQRRQRRTVEYDSTFSFAYYLYISHKCTSSGKCIAIIQVSVRPSVGLNGVLFVVRTRFYSIRTNWKVLNTANWNEKMYGMRSSRWLGHCSCRIIHYSFCIFRFLNFGIGVLHFYHFYIRFAGFRHSQSQMCSNALNFGAIRAFWPLFLMSRAPSSSSISSWICRSRKCTEKRLNHYVLHSSVVFGRAIASTTILTVGKRWKLIVPLAILARNWQNEKKQQKMRMKYLLRNQFFFLSNKWKKAL